MHFLFKKLEIKPKYFFGVIAFFFCLFIFICSALYPFTSDEVRFAVAAQENLFQAIKAMMFLEAPRFLNPLLITGLYWGAKFKIFFCIVNPLVQICTTYFLFYFIKGRKLNINKREDILPFSLICLSCLFMIPSPSSTLFWISGALDYSWAFLPCLLTLCLYRFTYKGEKFKNTWYINLICLFLGFASGMSNENTGPMMLGVSLCFILLCKYKKIKISSYIYLSFIGIILGISAMFGIGGSFQRLNAFVYNSWVNMSIGNKLFFSLHHFNNFLAALYYIPVIIFGGLLLVLYDIKKKVLQEKFILSAFFLLTGLLMAFVLFASPYTPKRAYYSAGIFCLISFFFFLDFFYDIYKIYILKYFTLLFLSYCLVISPLVIIPYVSLYKNFKIRESQILLSKKQDKTIVCTDRIYKISAPTKNLTIVYLDLVKHVSIVQHRETLKKWYGIEVLIPDSSNLPF